MPIDMIIDPDAKLVTFRVTGDTIDSEYYSAFSRQFSHPLFEDGMANLWILDGVTFTSHNKEEVQHTTEKERESGLLSKISKAAWVCKTDMEFATLRQFEIMNDDPNSTSDRAVCIFRKIDDAMCWLSKKDNNDDKVSTA